MSKTIERAFRFFDVDSSGVVRSRNGSLTWPAIGEWVEFAGKVEKCRSGLHASPTVLAALTCRQGSTLGCVEADGIEDRDHEKFACRRMRIVALYSRQHVVGLAALAAALSLKFFESEYPADMRPRKAILACLRWVASKPGSAADAAADASVAAASVADASAYAAAVSAASAASVAAASAASVADASAASAADAAWRSADASADARTEWRDEFNVSAIELLALPASRIGAFVRSKLPIRKGGRRAKA